MSWFFCPKIITWGVAEEKTTGQFWTYWLRSKGKDCKSSWRKGHSKTCSSETGPAEPSVCFPVPALGDQTCVLEHTARAIYHIFMVFLRINSSLNTNQDDAKLVTEVTSWTEIREVTFIFSYREHFHVNNLCLIKMSLSELGGSLKNGSNMSVLYFISPCFII